MKLDYKDICIGLGLAKVFEDYHLFSKEPTSEKIKRFDNLIFKRIEFLNKIVRMQETYQLAEKHFVVTSNFPDYAELARHVNQKEYERVKRWGSNDMPEPDSVISVPIVK